MCVVLGVGVISVFDAVAFLACMHRVSSLVSTKFLEEAQVKQTLPQDPLATLEELPKIPPNFTID